MAGVTLVCQKCGQAVGGKDLAEATEKLDRHESVAHQYD